MTQFQKLVKGGKKTSTILKVLQAFYFIYFI